MSVTIRKLSPSEWPDAWPLATQLRAIPEEDFLRSIRIQTMMGYELVGAFCNDAMTGFMGFRPVYTLARGPHLHIDDLVVDETHRNAGTGKLLLDFATDEAKNREMNFVFLDARPEAIPFYERNDFVFHIAPSMKKALR